MHELRVIIIVPRKNYKGMEPTHNKQARSTNCSIDH